MQCTSDSRRAVRRPEGPGADRQPRAARAQRRRRLHQRPAPRAVLRRLDRLRRAPRLRAGDDIRRVDWRLYARTDRYYVKQYEADTNTNFSVLLDISRSMGFASRGVSKLEYGCYPRRRASPIWRSASATASASSPSTTTSSRTCRRRRSTSTWCCTRWISAKAERPGNLTRAAQQDGGALQAPRHPAC